MCFRFYFRPLFRREIRYGFDDFVDAHFLLPFFAASLLRPRSFCESPFVAGVYRQSDFRKFIVEHLAKIECPAHTSRV